MTCMRNRGLDLFCYIWKVRERELQQQWEGARTCKGDGDSAGKVRERVTCTAGLYSDRAQYVVCSVDEEQTVLIAMGSSGSRSSEFV